jgi:hypothetical protein
MSEKLTAAEIKEVLAGKRSLPPRRMTEAARALAEATRQTFRDKPADIANKDRRIVAVEIPVRIESTPNLREHWAARHRRAKAQDDAVTYSLIGDRTLAALVATGGPYLVTLTRIAPRLCDDDNAIAGFKNVRDSIARLLGVDDGDASLVAWIYGQDKAKRYAAHIRIEAGRTAHHE